MAWFTLSNEVKSMRIFEKKWPRMLVFAALSKIISKAMKIDSK